MKNAVKYYGYRATESFYTLFAVNTDGNETPVKESFDLDCIESECQRLNRIVDEKNRKAGKYAFEV